MSHVAAGKACIDPAGMNAGGVDLLAIRAALTSLGDQLELVMGQKTFKWVGKWYNDYHENDAAYHLGIDPADYGKCEHAIRFKNAGDNDAEIGLVLTKDGYLSPVFDHYAVRGHELSGLVGGNDAAGFTQQFMANKIVAIASQNHQHKILAKEMLSNGAIRIRIGVKAPERV